MWPFGNMRETTAALEPIEKRGHLEAKENLMYSLALGLVSVSQGCNVPQLAAERPMDFPMKGTQEILFRGSRPPQLSEERDSQATKQRTKNVEN